jgi:hexosaminidase
MIGERWGAWAILFLLQAGCDTPLTLQAANIEMMQIIPRPENVEPAGGFFQLQPSTTIVAADDEDVRGIATWLEGQLEQSGRVELPALVNAPAAAKNAIVLEVGTLDDNPGREAYRLSVTPEKVVITANDVPGLFYGAVSLWQLATAGEPSTADGIRIPAVIINDAPRFAWRGLMLDVARHYLSPPFIKKMIDQMALHKLNVLHWHLTDDQGWRLEIDAFPRLTEVGAWRVPAGRGAQRNIDPATGEPRRYGGFYTKEEVRDIVAYAARRQITIVPEIDMPGHAQAAIAAYPEFGADGVQPQVSPDWGIHDYLFNVDENTFAAIETILAEVLELFPGEYIHVGGDEAVKDRWIASDSVQQRMRELGVEDETELQSYFIKRLERFLQANGRRLIGWDEILEGGIAPQATVMSWRGIDGAIEAAKLGHDAVLAPWPILYFDHRQSGLASEPPGRGLVVSLRDVYEFDPMPPVLAAAGKEHVLGVQANLWSEHIRTEERIGWMAFPRAAALAEVAWSQPERMDWEHFARRVATHFGRYQSRNFPFSTSAFDVQVTATGGSERDGIAVELSNQSGYGAIHYTTDGSEVTSESSLYSSPLYLAADVDLSAATFVEGRLVSQVVRGNVGQMTHRRFSRELTLCSEKLVLALEDDIPDSQRSSFLIDVMNPCWMWPQVDLAGVASVRVAVGQVPFNFQIGAARDEIELLEPETVAGELELRANGCTGNIVAVLPLYDAEKNDGVTVLSGELAKQPAGATDLCLRFRSKQLDPMWAIDWIELMHEASKAPQGTQ